jgi:general secretion pathway protein D
MVYLEGLIMEVNAERGFKLGVEWQGANSASYDGRTGAVIGGVSGDKGSYGIAQGLLANRGLPSGLSFGVIAQMITVATIGGAALTFPNLAAFIQAYQSDSDFRILSTPQLLTLDNEDAEITVGENVPYVSRQDSGVVGVTGTSNYSSYEYKDVGVTLKVTPQINKDGYVRMKLDQTVTKVVSQSASVDAQGSQVLTPTTLKRTAKTTVVVKSGETVVIGGMIQDDSESGTYKVPLLGDIPLLGWLFKSRSNAGKRTNLFVFITPRIIEQPEDARKIKEEKMDYMRIIQEGTIKDTPARRKEAKEKELEKELKIE